MSEKKAKTVYLADYQPPHYQILSVQLFIDVFDDYTQVRSELEIKQREASASCPPLVLDGEDLTLQQVMLDGQVLSEDRYVVTDESLTLNDLPDQFTLMTDVIIHPQSNTKLMGLYQSQGNLCTQCEAEGFRRITYYLDRPDVMSIFTVTIAADKASYPMLLSNGNLMVSQDLPEGRHQVCWHDPSLKPCYLFALVAGDFDLLEDSIVTCSGKTVALKFYVERGFLDHAPYAMGALKRAILWDEKAYGREYDLDIYMVVAVSDFSMGAMENKGLNIFNTKCALANHDIATDSDFITVEAVIAHEYFHNWSGNRVTCRDWFQLTLKEGFTVFREHHFSMDMTSRSYMRIAQVDVMRQGQFIEDAGPMSHAIREQSYMAIDNFYTMTVYEKGAEVIGMIQSLIGPELFRQGCDLYFERHDGCAVTTEDFVQAMVDVSGRDLSQFQRWYDQAGTPTVTVNQRYCTDTQEWTLEIAQSCVRLPHHKAALPFHIPFRIGAMTASGEPISLIQKESSSAGQESLVLELTDPKHVFVFKHIPSQPIPSLLRDFSAPVHVCYDYSDDELSTLVLHDTDAVVCCDAGRLLMFRVIERCAKQYEAGVAMELDPTLLKTIQCLMDNQTMDLYLKTHLISLPSLMSLLQKNQAINLTDWFAARRFVIQSLAVSCEDLLMSAYSQYHDDGEYVLTMPAVSKRAFKNSCLAFLVATGKATYIDLAVQQFSSHANMTCVMGALSALNYGDSDARTAALSEFHDRWQHEPLALNKWLSLHATVNSSRCCDDVRELLNHPSYHSTNPNNVYALLRGFAANAFYFHSLDASGYQLIADQIGVIDNINPLVASNLARAFLMWKTLDPERSGLIKQQLDHLLQLPKLSTNVYEIISKSVEA